MKLTVESCAMCAANRVFDGVDDVELMTVKDVAEALRVSARQVWKLLSGGRLPDPVRLGRSVRWRASDIASFVAVGCNMAAFEAVTAGKCEAGR